jgi:hypothetical protein
MTDDLIVFLTATTTIALILAATEWIDARRARHQATSLRNYLDGERTSRHKWESYANDLYGDLLTARMDIDAYKENASAATLTQALDALAAMQRAAENYRAFSEDLRHSLEEARADADRYAIAAQELHDRAENAERTAAVAELRYLGAVQMQLHAGMTMVIDHAGWRAPQ